MPRSPTPHAAIGRAISLRRHEQELKQDTLADAAGITDRHLRQIEAGTANPSVRVVDSIARALGWSFADLAAHADELKIEDRRPTNQPLKRDG